MKFRVLLFLISVLLFSACNQYEKLLKSSDYEKKYTKAIEYYEAKNYTKAYPLLEELVGIYRGTGKAEKIYYLYANCNYKMEDYIFAGFHFKNFAKQYPSSEYAEECLYLSAYCHYLQSPNPSLDQTETQQAIDEFQVFANRYPESTRLNEANEMIDKLRFKLETKAYQMCKQYYLTEDYKSSIIAIKNTLKDYPGTKYTEELNFLIVKSNFNFAINSVESKKKTRLNDTLESYYKFIDKYPQSKYIRDAEKIYESTNQLLKSKTI